MIKHSFIKIIFCLLALVSFACNSGKKSVKMDGCQTMASVKDFTGLDGCSLMIVLDNGDKLLPAKINDKNFTLRDGQRIKLDYTIMEDAMSVCMAEKASIEITCIQLIEGKPIIKECVETEEPMTVAWMKEVIISKKPASIQKYNFRDGWAYVYFVGAKQLLYDCQGTLLCEHEGLGVNQCKGKYLAGQKGKIIYRKSENPNR